MPLFTKASASHQFRNAAYITALGRLLKREDSLGESGNATAHDGPMRISPVGVSRGPKLLNGLGFWASGLNGVQGS